jgi:acetylornithine deacetylase/succinyl-diaminopimelate desuccinylase-like protein
MRFWLAALAASVLALGAVEAQTAPRDAAARSQARDIYARIIAYDSSLDGGETPAMAEFLAQTLRAGGFPQADVHLLPMEETALLVARYHGDGTGGPPILLIGHMDVVAARREEWTRDPFTLIEEDGFFFGRGALDMKASVALLTATFLRLRENGFTPTRDLILVFTGDEETSGASARQLLSQHRELVDAEFAINADGAMGALGETDGLARIAYIGTAEKSFASYVWTVRNAGGHSSRPRADNAIYDLGEALARLRAFEFPVMWNDTTIASFLAEGATATGEIGDAIRRFAANPGDRRAAARLSREPAYVGLIRTTCVPTLLSAGHADNALPQTATATINCRIFPGVSIEDVQNELQAIVGPGVGVSLRDPQYWSSPASPLRQDVFAAVTEAVHATHPGVAIAPEMSASASDGVFLRAAGIPTYGATGLFIKASDTFSHGLNERLPVASFYDGLVYWDVLIQALAGRR